MKKNLVDRPIEYFQNKFLEHLKSKRFHGALIGFTGAVVTDVAINSSIKFLIKKMKKEEFRFIPMQKSVLPPASILSIIIASIYGSLIDINSLEKENIILRGIFVSIIPAIIYTIYRFIVEVSSTDEFEKFGITKNLINGIKQVFLNTIAFSSAAMIANYS